MSQSQPAATAAPTIVPPATGRLPLSVNSSASPAVVSVSGHLFVFYKGVTDDPGIYITRTVAVTGQQQQWTDAVRLPKQVNTSDGPTAVVQGSTIYLFYKGAGSDTQIWGVRSSDAGATWSQAVLPNGVNTSAGPGALIFGDSFYVVYRGSGNDQGVYIAPVPNGMKWQPIS